MIDTTTGNKNLNPVTFQNARRADMIVSSKQSQRHSTSPPEHVSGRDSHIKNTHTALSKAKKKNKSKKDTTFIHFGNDNWNLVLHMLFGIRQSVHSVMHDDVYRLTDAEF